MKNQNKTMPTDKNVLDFLAEWTTNDQKYQDSLTLIDMMQRITGQPPKMWGPTIVGFGLYHYVSPGGREGDWPVVAFSPRKAAISLYIVTSVERYAHLIAKLGTVKTGKGCIYVKKLADIDLAKLEHLIRTAYQDLKKEFTVVS